MAYTRFKMASYGAAHGGKTTVGYQLFNPDGTANGPRITAGVTERGTGTGIYGADVAFPDNFRGEIRWDTGGASPAVASEEINPIIIDLEQPVPTSNTAQTLGDALNAARADGFGKVTLVGTTLTLYAPDGATPVRAFTLDNPANPTQRT